MISLTNKESKSHPKQKTCYIWKKEFSTNDKKCYKVRDYCHHTEEIEALLMMFAI